MDDADLTTARILIVDDEPLNVRLLERLLTTAGYRNLTATTDPREVVGLCRAVDPDLILLDLMMPYLDGVAVLAALAAQTSPDAWVPVLVLTADATSEAKRRALTAGAHDFVTKPFDQFEVLLRIRNLLDTRRLHLALHRHNRSLEQTVRERTERLLQSEKVATMGSLLAGVAHELNNPLAALSGHAQLLRDSTGAADAVVKRRAGKICDASDRCVRIVRNFLALARQHPPERALVALNDVVRAAIELLTYELRTEDVELVLELGNDLPILSADQHQLHQVLVNLIVNAQQALRKTAGRRAIVVSTRPLPNRRAVQLVVADSGPGIPAEIQAKVFEAFFTTKPPGEGTGLGLSLCREIIDAHGGTITIDSAPGRGTQFVITLPVSPSPVVADTVPVEDIPAPTDAKRILVVDDEIDVATVISEALQCDAHMVTIAPNGADALELLGAASFDLVISDTKMPVMDGEAFWMELQRRFPALDGRVIFLTGDAFSGSKRDFLERTGAPYLVKPCDLGEVRRLVRRTLGSSPVSDRA
jgi:two-component system NtrC family sensor kinase